MPLRTTQQQHLPDIALPVIHKRLKSLVLASEKPIENTYLKDRHRHLRLRFAKEFLERSVSFWRPRFPRSYAKRQFKFRHLTQMFIWCISWLGILSFGQKSMVQWIVLYFCQHTERGIPYRQ